jgi:hypothetical protein
MATANKTRVSGLLKTIRKRTESASFNDSHLIDINEYISTGSYGINRIITGDIYQGIPEGRIITLAGESQCTPKNQQISILYKKFT